MLMTNHKENVVIEKLSDELIAVYKEAVLLERVLDVDYIELATKLKARAIEPSLVYRTITDVIKAAVKEIPFFWEELYKAYPELDPKDEHGLNIGDWSIYIIKERKPYQRIPQDTENDVDGEDDDDSKV